MWGRRIIFGAVAWIMLSAQAPEPVEQNSGNQSRTTQADERPNKKQLPVAISGGGFPSRQVAPDHDAAAKQDRERADSDLKAQWEVAFWTKWMTLAAVGALLLSAVGIALIYLTFGETRKAAKAASDTHQGFVNVERARVVISGESPFTETDYIMLVRASVTNIGRSSAAIICGRFAMLEGVDFPDTFTGCLRIDLPLPAGQGDRLGIARFDLRLVNERSFLGGFVEYQTTFGTTHKSYFLLSLGTWNEGQGYVAFKDHPYIDRESRKRFGWPDDT